jgi:hypothetical protein
MSSSFLSRRRRMADRSKLGIAVTCLLGASGAASAAEVYLQPLGEVLVDVDSNRTLATSGQKITSEGYAAQAGAILGVLTPVSDATVKAQAGYQDYPKLNEHEVQGSAELATEYRWERSTFTASGQFDRLNTFSSELASALYDPLVPVSPTTPQTARITANTTRTLGNFVPKYDYRLSQRSSVGVSGVVELTDYSGQAASGYVSYTYGQASVFGGYAITPRLDVTVGPFVSRDVARNGGGSVNGIGGNLSLTYKWSATFKGRLDVSGESDENNLPQLGVTRVRTKAFGGTYTTTWTGQISQLQLGVGRQLTPSGAGGEYFADQLQVEYDRSLTARLTTASAVRLIRYSASVDQGQGQSAAYKYVDATVGLKWMATRTWHLDTGLEFVRVDYGAGAGAASSGAANNFRLFVGFGYTGLGRQSAPTYR